MGASDREVGMILEKLENMENNISEIKDEFKRMDKRQDEIVVEQTRIKTFAKGSWWLVGGICTIIPAIFAAKTYFSSFGG